MRTSIDVIIPSFRLNAETLLPILQLERPANVAIQFYLVADNPGLQPDAAITQMADGKNIHLLINPQNMGASATRNRGMEAGTGEWILFLDDDIEVDPDILITYANAAVLHPDEIGFIGLVNMPPPPTAFARAVDANGSMGIFGTAKDNTDYPWGATANIMIRRNAVGAVRFSSAYPKTGGGEEVEFFLRVRQQNNFKNYKCLPVAQATHPWWKNGQTDYTRFYRYGLGNSYLAQRNPQYRWYDFLNTSETLLLTALIAVVALPFKAAVSAWAVSFALFSMVLEFLVSQMRVQRKLQKASWQTALTVMLLRNVYEWGILCGNLKRLRLAGIGERFNYDGSTRPKHFRLNRYKIVKLVLYLLIIIAALSAIL